jgi:hypothetical protein
MIIVSVTITTGTLRKVYINKNISGDFYRMLNYSGTGQEKCGVRNGNMSSQGKNCFRL